MLHRLTTYTLSPCYRRCWFWAAHPSQQFYNTTGNTLHEDGSDGYPGYRIICVFFNTILYSAEDAKIRGRFMERIHFFNRISPMSSLSTKMVGEPCRLVKHCPLYVTTYQLRNLRLRFSKLTLLTYHRSCCFFSKSSSLDLFLFPYYCPCLFLSNTSRRLIRPIFRDVRVGSRTPYT